MRSAAAIARDVDRGAEIVAKRKALDAELKDIEARLEQDALDRPDEHEPLADADREGKQFLAAGTGITLPIVFTADKLVKTFAPKSDVHERIEAASDGQLLRFYRLKPVYECTQKDGKAMRSFAAEILGPKAPALIAAVRQVDKFGVPKSDIKLEWSAALAEAGE